MLSTTSTLPWCCIGDFNDICSNEEKRGNTPHPAHLMRGFCEAISDSRLQDIPLQGYQFTWERGRGTEHWVEERLDRAVANTNWLSLFPTAKLTNLVAMESGHSPIELQTVQRQVVRQKFRFRFENS